MSIHDPAGSEVKVSVCMITYNHEPYIAQAIEGVLMQETDFAVELVIGEDCSTDGTRAIVMEYVRRYPDRIRPLLPEHNLGMMPNFIATMQACRGQYIALCEGDDYWTDPHKLQKQVEFLEAHAECALCCHPNYKLFQATGEIIVERPDSRRRRYKLDDVLSVRFGTHTASTMFRNTLGRELPSWLYRCPSGDTALFAILAQHGALCVMDEVMSVYRVHHGGVWQGVGERDRTRMNLETLLLLQDQFGQSHGRAIRIPIANNYLQQARLAADEGESTKAKSFIIKSIRTSFSLHGKWLDQLTMLGRLYAPELYRLVKAISTRTSQ